MADNQVEPTGLYSTNLGAETSDIWVAAHTLNYTGTLPPWCWPTAYRCIRPPETAATPADTRRKLTPYSSSMSFVLKRIPSHRGAQGNEELNRLFEEGRNKNKKKKNQTKKNTTPLSFL